MRELALIEKALASGKNQPLATKALLGEYGMAALEHS